jgi:DeoR family glycerol-3-phosphate regulon repressor
MDYDLDEAEFARTVITRGRRTLVVTDQSKFGREGLVRVCGFEAIAELATDVQPPPDIAEAMAAAGTGLLLA